MKHMQIFLILIFIAQTTAASDSAMTFQLYEDDCGAAACEVWIIAEGIINQETPHEFDKFMGSIDYIPPVSLSGPGGNLSAAIKLAKAIRAKGLDTFVAGAERVNLIWTDH